MFYRPKGKLSAKMALMQLSFFFRAKHGIGGVILECYQHDGVCGNKNVILDFSVSVNPLGMPEEVKCALISRINEFAHYPDPERHELRAAIALNENINAECIVCGNGAADLIYRLCGAVKPRKALICVPTFSEYERALKLYHAKVRYHALTPENQFALTDSFLERLTPDIDIVFLCNPNDPTGRLIHPRLLAWIINIARQNRTKIVVDERFLDFTDGVSTKEFMTETHELVILKAFTKIFAMAGLRLGYILSSDSELLSKINFEGQRWNVSVPAQIAGSVFFDRKSLIEKTRRLVLAEREFLSENLSRLGINVFKSDANFLLIKSESPLYEPLLRRGILIRPYENYKGLDRYYYGIGLKTRNDNTRLINELKEILN